MNIGYLDRRITFVAPATTTDAYGAVRGSGTDYATVWAALDNKSANNSVIQEQETTRNVVTWRVRNSSTTRQVTPKYTIRYGSETYNILAIQEVGRKAELHFITERVISK